jgi:enoyl reductase-like protein
VFDQDPQRVCILQGPVAVKHLTTKDQPIKELLGGINNGLIQRLLERNYGGDISKVPVADYLGAKPAPSPSLTGVTVEKTDSETTYTVGSTVPDTATWLESLAGPRLNWLRAFLTSITIVQGTGFIDNPMRRIFAPRTGQKVFIKSASGVPTGIAVFGSARSFGVHKPEFKAVDVAFDASKQTISTTLFEDRHDATVPLYLEFKYRPDVGSLPIHEVLEGRNKRIKEFYWRLWFGNNEVLPAIDVRDTFTGPEVKISAKNIETFCDVVGNQNEAFKTARNDTVKTPMDFAIVTGWQASVIVYCLFIRCLTLGYIGDHEGDLP